MQFRLKKPPKTTAASSQRKAHSLPSNTTRKGDHDMGKRVRVASRRSHIIISHHRYDAGKSVGCRLRARSAPMCSGCRFTHSSNWNPSKPSSFSPQVLMLTPDKAVRTALSASDTSSIAERAALWSCARRTSDCGGRACEFSGNPSKNHPFEALIAEMSIFYPRLCDPESRPAYSRYVFEIHRTGEPGKISRVRTSVSRTRLRYHLILSLLHQKRSLLQVENGLR